MRNVAVDVEANLLNKEENLKAMDKDKIEMDKGKWGKMRWRKAQIWGSTIILFYDEKTISHDRPSI